MVVIMGKESVYSRGDFQLEPEFIYEWEAHQSNEEHTYSGFAELIGDILEIIVEILLTWYVLFLNAVDNCSYLITIAGE